MPDSQPFSSFRLSCSAEKKVTSKFLRAVEVQSSNRDMARLFKHSKSGVGAAKMIERLAKKFKRAAKVPTSSRDQFSQLVAPLKVPQNILQDRPGCERDQLRLQSS